MASPTPRVPTAEVSRISRSRTARNVVLGVGWLALLASLTLTPIRGPDAPLSTALCLICGTRGAADALLNLAFFTPVGLLLGGRRHAILVAGAAGLALSAGIETAQLFIPGRHPTLGDLVWNGLGAPAGVVLWHVLRARPHRGRRFPSWAGGAAAGALGGLALLAGWLMAPLPTEDVYWGQWTPVRPSMSAYDGALVEARLDGRPVPRGRIPEEWRVFEDLAGDWSLVVTVVVGSPPPLIAPILTLGDDAELEIVMVGALGRSLVLRERTRGAAVRLDQPDLRLPEALEGYEEGDTLSITVDRQGPLRCFTLESERACLRLPLGRTWGLFIYPHGAGPRALAALDALWIALLFSSVGFLSATAKRAAAHGSILAAFLLLAPLVTRLAPPTGLEIAGGVLGLLVGLAGGLVIEARRPSPPASPERAER